MCVFGLLSYNKTGPVNSTSVDWESFGLLTSRSQRSSAIVGSTERINSQTLGNTGQHQVQFPHTLTHSFLAGLLDLSPGD
jgi:hypothetical protein